MVYGHPYAVFLESPPNVPYDAQWAGSDGLKDRINLLNSFAQLLFFQLSIHIPEHGETKQSTAIYQLQIIFAYAKTLFSADPPAFTLQLQINRVALPFTIGCVT